MSTKKAPQTIPELFDVTMHLFEGVGSHLSSIEERLDGIDKRLDGIDQRFDRMETTMREGFPRSQSNDA